MSGNTSNNNMWSDAGLDESLENLACRLDNLPCKFSDLPKPTQNSFLNFFKHILPPPACPNRPSNPEHEVHFRYLNNRNSESKRIQPRYICRGCPAKRPTLKDPYFEFTFKPEDYLNHLIHLGGLHSILQNYIMTSKNNSNKPLNDVKSSRPINNKSSQPITKPSRPIKRQRTSNSPPKTYSHSPPKTYYRFSIVWD